jgi:hypothetical protein
MASTWTRTGAPGGGWLRRPLGGAALAVFGVGCCLVASGCGGGSPSSGVAHVASTKSGATASASEGAPSKGDAAAYSACMRKNGVANFPDPDSSGRIKLTFGRGSDGTTTGVDSNSPQFKKAEQACHRLLPNGGRPSAAARQKEIQQALRFAQCMRSHGVPKYPDPKVGSDGGIGQAIDQSVHPGSPQFVTAQKACQKLVPGSAMAEGPPPGNGPPAGASLAPSGG